MTMFNVLVLVLMLCVAFYSVKKSNSKGSSEEKPEKVSRKSVKSRNQDTPFANEMAEELRQMIVGTTRDNQALKKQVFRYVEKVDELSKVIVSQGNILKEQSEMLMQQGLILERQSEIIGSQGRQIAALQKSNNIKTRVIVAADKLVRG